MLRRRSALFAFTALAALGACVAAATLAAPSRASARSVAACPLSRLATAKSLKGVAGLSYDRTATGDVPGAKTTKILKLDRKLENTTVTLTRLRSRLPGVFVFAGKGRGGTLSVDDTVAYGTGEKGKLESTASPTSVSALAAFSLAGCKAWFELGYSGRGTYSGDPRLRPGTSVSGYALSYPDENPGASTFASVEPVPALHSGCTIDLSSPPTEGCFRFSGGWANDFATLAHCKSIVATGCAPESDPVGKALLRWSVKPSFK